MGQPKPQEQILYGLPAPATVKSPSPILAKRNPLPTDTGYPLGILWVNKINNTAYILTSVSVGAANWLSI